MNVCISKSIIGGNNHLLYDGETFGVSRSIPDDTWVFGNEDSHAKSVEFLLRAVGEDPILWPSENLLKMYSTIRDGNTSDVKWCHVLPKDDVLKLTQKLLDCIWRLLDKWKDTYYMKELVYNRQFLMNLCRARVDSRLLEKISKSIRQDVKSFFPEKDGLLKKVVYDQFGTQTGRLVVSSGPSILTLRKDVRGILKSNFEDGVIAEIDFVSMEPRIALGMCEKYVEGDVYEYFSNELFTGKKTRDEVKIAILSTLYGSAPSSMEEKIMRETIREKFQISSWERKLKKQLESCGHITNLFGRKLVPKTDKRHVLYNNLIQSTAADASILAFSDLVSSLRSKGSRVLPLFIIHDALIVDIPKSEFQTFLKNRDGIKIEKPDVFLPLKSNILSSPNI